jgi:hypothetical protein
MKCPHLIKWVLFACKANEKPYFPSNFQLHEYCKTEEHKKCPFYQGKLTTEKEPGVLIPMFCI